MKRDGFLYLKQDVKAYYKGVLLAAAYIIFVNLLFGHMCPGVLMTGLPCPACGLTKAGIYVLTLQFSKAWMMNPVIYAVGAFLLYFIICRYICAKPVSGWKWMLWGILIFLLGVYLYRMVYCFPEEVVSENQRMTPMHYDQRNLLRWFLRKVFKG